MPSRPSPIVSAPMLQHVAAQAEFSVSYVVLMATAGVLAAVALLTNSVPILVGAMVVAPAFGPLALIAFALVGRQPPLALSGVWVAGIGLLVATGGAMLTTWLMNVTHVLPPEANLLNKPRNLRSTSQPLQSWESHRAPSETEAPVQLRDAEPAIAAFAL
jgi:uncharacterized membrane protein